MKIVLFLCLFQIAAESVSAAVHTLNAEETQLFRLVARLKEQGRPELTLDPILCVVARKRAEDMIARNYVAHVNPDGKGVNKIAKEAKYWLPDDYSAAKNGNNLESIASGPLTPAKTVGYWLESPGHRSHVLAEAGFFQLQTRIGVGVVFSPDTGATVFVFLSAPENLNPHPPYWVLRNPNRRAITTTGTAPVAKTRKPG